MEWVAGLSWSDDYREMLRLLKEARKKKGLTQVEVAEALGWGQSLVSKIERGEIRIDPIELRRFAELYGVELSDLVPKKAK